MLENICSLKQLQAALTSPNKKQKNPAAQQNSLSPSMSFTTESVIEEACENHSEKHRAYMFL